ncbi:MAG: hypothetical protein D6824_07625, partial [Planctomycetota bacterium]
NSLILNNICLSNGVGASDGAGVHATGLGSRIEGNTVAANDRGIDVDATNNFIVRNTARANTLNYDIVAGNHVGVIILAPSSGAVSGATGGTGVGATDPWANFSL